MKTNAVPIVIEQNNYKVTYPAVVALGETREDHPAGTAMLNLPPGQDGVAWSRVALHVDAGGVDADCWNAVVDAEDDDEQHLKCVCT